MSCIPLTDPKSQVADLPGSPVMFNGRFEGPGPPATELTIPVLTLSDGIPAHGDAQYISGQKVHGTVLLIRRTSLAVPTEFN